MHSLCWGGNQRILLGLFSTCKSCSAWRGKLKKGKLATGWGGELEED